MALRCEIVSALWSRTDFASRPSQFIGCSGFPKNVRIGLSGLNKQLNQQFFEYNLLMNAGWNEK